MKNIYGNLVTVFKVTCILDPHMSIKRLSDQYILLKTMHQFSNIQLVVLTIMQIRSPITVDVRFIFDGNYSVLNSVSSPGTQLNTIHCAKNALTGSIRSKQQYFILEILKRLLVKICFVEDVQTINTLCQNLYFETKKNKYLIEEKLM